MQAIKEVNPHPRIVPLINMWSVFYLFIIIMPLDELSVHRSATLSGKAKWEIDIWRWVMCYDTMDFPYEDFFSTLNLISKPSLLPLTYVVHLSAI